MKPYGTYAEANAWAPPYAEDCGVWKEDWGVYGTCWGEVTYAWGAGAKGAAGVSVGGVVGWMVPGIGPCEEPPCGYQEEDPA